MFQFLDKLRESVRNPVKRCRERSLKEAIQLLQKEKEKVWEADEGEITSVLNSVIALQMKTIGNSSSFQKLEKIIQILAESKEELVLEELRKRLPLVVESEQILSIKGLQTVSAFVEDSCLGRQVFRENLQRLLHRAADTLESVLQEETARTGEHCSLTVKVCLLIFQLLPEEMASVVWSKTENDGSMQRILECMLQHTNRDCRLLAGTALATLINTAPDSSQGAIAAFNTIQLVTRGDVSEFTVGTLTVSVLAPRCDGMEKLAVSQGLVSCCRKDILLTKIHTSQSELCLLVDVLFPLISALCEEKPHSHCHIFQAVSMWLKCLKESLTEAWGMMGARLLDGNSDLLQNLTELIWKNAESLVEGASEFVHTSFCLLLEIYELECRQFEDVKKPFYTSSLQKIMSLSWQVKARYSPLCALLPYAGTTKVLEMYRDLPQHLLHCLSTNHLSPSASEVYKTAIQLQRQEWMAEFRDASEMDLAEKWAQHWHASLFEGLTSNTPFLQNNTSSYLLVWTLRTFPDAFHILDKSFSTSCCSHLRAWMALLSVQRMTTSHFPSDSSTLAKLRLCLHSQDENVRLAILGFLCCSPKTNQALSEMELSLLRQFLPSNMNCDSSSFRQLLQASVKKALVRLRDSCLVRLRGNKGKTPNQEKRISELAAPDPVLSQGIDFVDWLLCLSVSSLAPGLNYQRKKTALLLLSAVLETCTDCWTPEKKKGQPPPNMAELLHFARQRGCWDFFSNANLLLLLSCLQDGTNEIRDFTAELLLKHFPHNLPEHLAAALFEHAQKTMCSPRVQEAESGAVMMQVVLQKSDSIVEILKQSLTERKQNVTSSCKALLFVSFLLGIMEDQYAAAHRDFLQAAATTPMHGVMRALCRCLLETPEAESSLQMEVMMEEWRDVLSRLVTVVKQTVSFLLGVLCGTQEASTGIPEAFAGTDQASTLQQAAAPSFAEMGNAIRAVIERGRGLELLVGEDMVLLSEEHNLILTCCWVSIKEIGMLLGTLVEKVWSLALPAGLSPLLSVEDLKKIAKVFQEILLGCRHWGAVEGCSLGFTKFCVTVLNHPCLELQGIPQQMLEQVL
nr:PREDICTED: thyroid adenoma-associated protein homolog isoform X2 [Latimeria chalumnae]|eukprot:XP_014340597.1 PREDICTED: thyroid adenoma-associated protein homolog isoform X2 [Latimeria chalumnae]